MPWSSKGSIVTHKVQTTRARIRGVAIEGDAQIVFVDTPGLFRPRRRSTGPWSRRLGRKDADVVVLMVEAHCGITEGVSTILEALPDHLNPNQTVALAINKIDRVKSEVLLKLTKDLNEAYQFAETFMISAEKGHGVDACESISVSLPEGHGFIRRIRSRICRCGLLPLK